MKAELVHLDHLLLGGVSFYGDPFCVKGGWDSDNEIGNTCRRYAEIIAGHPALIKPNHPRVFYEIHIYSSETTNKGYFEVFAGEEMTTVQLPVELVTKFIAASDYLKVTLSGKEITEDWWQKLDEKLLSEFGVIRNGAYIIQAYDERFKGMDQLEASKIDAYIPVEKA